MHKKNFKSILSFLFVLGFIYLGLFLIIKIAVGKSNKDDLIDNYEDKKKEIHELKNYINLIVPENFNVYVEFISDDKIDIRVSEKTDSTNDGNILWFEEWNINPYDYKDELHTNYEEYGSKTKSLDVIKKKIKWTDGTFRELKKRLDLANCISVENGIKCEIGFKRSMMSKYCYLIFNENLDKKMQEKYSDDCMYLFFKENIVFSYYSPAFGSICTSEFKK